MAGKTIYLCDIPNLSIAQRVYLHHNQLDPNRIYDMNKSTFPLGAPTEIIVGYYNDLPVFLHTDGETYSDGKQTALYPNFMSQNDIHIFTPNKMSNVKFVSEQLLMKTEILKDNQLSGLEISKEQMSSLQKHMLDFRFIVPLNTIFEQILNKPLFDRVDPKPTEECLDEENINQKSDDPNGSDKETIMTYAISNNVVRWVQLFKPIVNVADIKTKMDKAIIIGISEKTNRPIFLKADGWFSDGVNNYWPSYKLIRLSVPSILQQSVCVPIPMNTPVYEFVLMDHTDAQLYMGYNAKYNPGDILKNVAKILSNFSVTKLVKTGIGATVKTIIPHQKRIDSQGGKKYIGGNIPDQTKTLNLLSGKPILKQKSDVTTDGSINFGKSTFFKPDITNGKCQQVPMVLKQNGLFSDGKYEYIYKKKMFMRITQEEFKRISVWQILSISHHQLDWNILWLLNRGEDGTVALWDQKRVKAIFPSLANTQTLYNCILVGYSKETPVTPVFLKPDGWFSNGTLDYWPTYMMIPDRTDSYEFEWYNVVGDKFKGLFLQGKRGIYRPKEGVTLDVLRLSQSQQNSIKQHYMDYQTILDLNVNGKFTLDRLRKQKWKVNGSDDNHLPDAQLKTLVGSILVGIFIGDVNDKKLWIFLKEDGWFSDGINNFWPNYELYATRNGGLYYTFEYYDMITSMVSNVYYIYNINFNHPLIGTGMVLSTIVFGEMDIDEFINYFSSSLSDIAVELGLGITTGIKFHDIAHVIHKGSETKSDSHEKQPSHGGKTRKKKKQGGKKTKYKRIKKYKNKRFSI